MWTLIRNGGVVSMSFILVMAGTGLIAAFHFALRARREHLGFVYGMAVATLFGTLGATCADVGATLSAGAKFLDRGESERVVAQLVAEGLSESTSPGILGFAFLALIAMLVAVGRRRMDA
jgi:hypothetical protein